MRLVISANPYDPGGLRAEPHADAVAGADDGVGLFAVALGDSLPSRRAEDLFAGWWQLIAALGVVPRTLVWDGEGAIGRYRSGKSKLTRDCQAFRGVLGTKVVVLKPREPEHKGSATERAHV